MLDIHYPLVLIYFSVYKLILYICTILPLNEAVINHHSVPVIFMTLFSQNKKMLNKIRMTMIENVSLVNLNCQILK